MKVCFSRGRRKPGVNPQDFKSPVEDGKNPVVVSQVTISLVREGLEVYITLGGV